MNVFEEWLIKYIATQKNSNYNNHNQVACALEYVLDRYKKYLREEIIKNGITK